MFQIAKILLPVDFSERASNAVRFAVPVAERFRSEIVLLHVLPPHYEFGTAQMGAAILRDLVLERRRAAEQQIEGFLSAELRHLPVRHLLLDGDPAHEIVACARREEVGLIMMPTHGYGPFRRMLLGSVTAKVLHDADCPVWTTVHMEAPAASPDAVKRIMCAVDLGPASARALDWAVRLAAEFGAQLTLVHAIVELDPRVQGYYFSPEWRKTVVDAAEAKLAALQKNAGTQAEVNLTLGPAPEMVCAEARNQHADLLVIGRGLNAGILGRLTSAAYALIRQSPCPVVSV